MGGLHITLAFYAPEVGRAPGLGTRQRANPGQERKPVCARGLGLTSPAPTPSRTACRPLAQPAGLARVGTVLSRRGREFSEPHFRGDNESEIPDDGHEEDGSQGAGSWW